MSDAVSGQVVVPVPSELLGKTIGVTDEWIVGSSALDYELEKTPGVVFALVVRPNPLGAQPRAFGVYAAGGASAPRDDDAALLAIDDVLDDMWVQHTNVEGEPDDARDKTVLDWYERLKSARDKKARAK